MTGSVAMPVEVDYDPFASGTLERVVATTEPQREVWLAAQLAVDASLAYNESVSLRLRGNLDVEALRNALDRLVGLHDALRSTIGPDGESFCVLEQGATVLEQHDLSALAVDAREQALQQRLRSSVETPFVLEQGPLFRSELLRLASDEHLLLLSAHHIVCDGWSWWVIVRELGALYAQQRGQGHGVPDAVSSYADYASAEAGQDDSSQLREDQQYWLSCFADEVAALDLPVDRARPGRRGFTSLREDYTLDAELVTALRKFGARRGASLFATLLAGFSAVISRVSGQRDVVVGIPAAGQSIDGHDSLVGHCVNLLPLRFDVDPLASFPALLDQSKETLLDAIEHQRLTFGTLLKKINVSRDPSRLPLVSVMFNIDQALDQQREVFPGLGLDFTTNPRSFENFELSINAVQAAGELRLECQYNCQLFEPTTIRRWLSAYESLLRGAIQHGDTAVSRLALVDVAAHMDLVALQPASETYPRERLMHEFFEASCDLDPQRTAVVFGDISLSYADLEARANRIAHLLRARGARHGTLVGLSLDRGIDMLAALLGILKTGAGYVPLDPQFPADRIAYMAEDAGLAALVTQSAHAQNFSGHAIPLLLMDTAQEELQAASPDRLDRDAQSAQPESIAYVIYTSGSTGKPKGVQVPHRAVANFLTSMGREPGLGPDDTLVAVTTLSFDIAVLELLLPLSVGAQVVLASRDTVMDGGAFMRLLDASAATVVQATPAMWRLLLDAGWKGHSGFKALCGGEPLPHDLATQLLSRCGELWNLYGPTETTVWSTATRIVAGEAGAAPDIHIGRPILNTQIWILDEHGEPCPRGVPGEICIGGEGVTLGYLHRPELTAEKFIVDRFGDGYADNATGQAGIEVLRRPLYRTGDRGRWRNDGNVEHLGRLDFQVKVRGYRIELGEIENNLSSHPEVTRNIVLAREDRPGDMRLVAYVVLAPGAHADEPALAAHLRATLPDYMIPQHIVALAAMPLLPNGKIDRKALPAPMQSGPAATARHTPPRDKLEASIVQAMEEVLGRPGLGVDDGFFEMGGHSLLAARLCSRLTLGLGVQVPLRTLFEAPTAARLANALRDSVAAPDADEAAARIIPHRAQQSRAPMTLMQQRLWVLEQMEPGGVVYNTPSAHRLRGPMDLQAFESAFQEMIRRQPSLRTVLVADGDAAVQQVLENIDFSLLPLTDLCALPEAEREAALMVQLEAMTDQPFVLDQAPLFRARLFRLGAEDHVLYFMTHHVIWDGWSFDVFYSEMSALYEAFSAGAASPLPELEVTYGDYAAWQQQWLGRGELDQQLAHWKQHLAGELEPLHLPEDLPRPAVGTGKGSTEWVKVDRATTDMLRGIGMQVGATLFMTLLAAYYVLLHRLSGQSDLVVGLPVRNRNSEALEKVMGFFVNALPLRMRIDAEKPFLEVVKQVRDAVVESFAYPDVPFEHLVRELKLPRDQSRSPLYQALFSFQDVRARKTRWGQLEHEHLLMFQKGMSSDIGLWFLEHEHGLSGAMGYNTDIISAQSAALFNHRFLALLQSLCSDPGTTVGDATILCAQDLDALAEWNSTHAPLPAQATLHALLKAQALRTPARTALRFDGQAMSYAQLDERSTRIANALRQRGVQAGDLVGISLDRSPDLVASMLAVLKAGAAYVPLDPAYPPDRLRFMADDARLTLVVSQGKLGDPLDWPRDRTLLLDADAQSIAEAAAEAAVDDAAEAAGPDSIAYVIYTSGSTGKPKGVQIPHRAVVNFLESMRHAPGLGSEDRLLAVTTTSFDIAVLEIFLPLSVGAEVVLASREAVMDGHDIAALIDAHAVSVMQATPAAWRMLVESGWKGRPGFKALCGGEPLPPDLATALQARCAEVWNMYGPTETTVWSTCWRLDDSARTISIGKPIANTTVWILDARGRPCPVGVSGEIYIGGEGMAAGYLHRPELTAERFIADHIVGAGKREGVTGATAPRLYRTGDRGRWHPDGLLEHQGRLDFQVKVRGHRIELGEIESNLVNHPGVTRSVVVAREDMPGDIRLVAYVVPGADGFDETALAAHLKGLLPSYMIPQHIVALDVIPLLPNGKVDRKSLPKPQSISHDADSFAQPGDALERSIANIMAEVLGVSAVSIDDDFFSLGGYSLLAVKMFHRINRETGVNLPLAVLFKAPSVRSLACAYRDSGASVSEGMEQDQSVDDHWTPLVLLQQGTLGFPLFLIHAVGGNVLNYRALAKRLPKDQTIYGLQALGLDGRTLPLPSVEAMAERYVAEMLKVQPSGPYHVAGGSMGGLISYEIAQQLVSRGHEVAFLGLFDTSSGRLEVPQSVGMRIWRHFRAWSFLRIYKGIASRARLVQRRLKVMLARSIGAELPHEIRYLEVHRVHYLAACRYTVRPYSGDIVVFRAKDQYGKFSDSPTLGWSCYVRHVLVKDIPGNHDDLVEAPELARELKASLAASSRASVDRSSTAAFDRPPAAALGGAAT